MKSDTPLDYAVFQLSPKHSRCELFVSRGGNMEKLASGLVKPFVTHLKVAEEQVTQAVHSIKLEAEKYKNAETWFTKGTLERFVRFVSTPEVLEMVNTFDAEMSQLEGARKIYSQGTRDQPAGAAGGDVTGTLAGADATKKELLRAIDVRLAAVKQDLTTACARASAAGFNPETVSELQLFSDCFGAHRLNEACTKFISVCDRRSDLVSTWKPRFEDQVVRASWGSDMSIDDPTEDPSGPNDVKPHQSSKHQHQLAGQEQQPNLTQPQNNLNQSKVSAFHPNSSLSAQNENKEGEKKEESLVESSSSQPSQPNRRLSVQDRINLFENKQKESSGGKPAVVGKSVELRRLSSDVSSAPEKAVLRRWSGTSDMSIDLGNDKKDFTPTDSPLCTPSSSSVSQSKSNVFPSSSADYKDQKVLNDTASSVKVESKSVSEFKDQCEFQTTSGGSVGKDEDVGSMGKVNRKDQVGSQPQLRAFAGRGEQAGLDQVVRDEKFKGTFGGDERFIEVKDQAGFDGKLRGYSDRGDAAGVNNQAGCLVGKVSNTESGNRVEDVLTRDKPQNHSRLRGSQIHTRSLSGQFEGGFGGKVKEVEYKETERDQSASQPPWKSSAGEVEQVGKKLEDPEGPRIKVQKPHSAGAEQVFKLQGRREESGSNGGSNKPIFPSKKATGSQESFSTVPIPSVEQAQRIRQSKGNQELNDELKMKANELEKLFAEHKLRVPGDQSGSTRRSKPTESQFEQATRQRKQAAVEISPVHVQDNKTEIEPIASASYDSKFSTPPPTKMVDHLDYGSSLRQNFSDLSLSDDSRGKFYEKYMQKRDAKLREEWGTNRAEKEAKLKSMQDSLERSRAEMKAKFSGSADRQDSASTARRAEKLRTYHSRSDIKREQNLVDSFQSEEDEYTSDTLDQKHSRSFQNKKSLKGNLSSSTPRTAVASIPRSSTKMSNSSSGRRRMQSENPLAQSVPNFSDFRKENTKPSSGLSKTANRNQVRNFARSKSTNEDIPPANEEKPRRTQSLRKSSASPAEFKDLPTLDSDDVVLAPLKFEKEQTEQAVSEKFSKNVESKNFLRKGNGIGPGAGTSIAKLKASVAYDAIKNEEFEDSPFETEDSVNVTKEEEEEEEPELETTEVEDCANNENGNPRLSQESEKMSESENGDSLRSLSQIVPSSVAELPASVPSTFHAIGSLPDSPGESPVSWNSRMHNPFSYPHEISDIDASVDSPIGSPAAWNPHPLTQTEVDAARMRKKWGSAQKPVLVANSSHHQGRKDVTKGFKRLLKFGRKSRGTESLVDWISATTSEGDDDTEDGRDPANRSSEDLRKSRMGFSQSHPSDDGFNESELLNELVSIQSSIPAPPENFKLRDDLMSGSSMKAPRSFFSLSTFRSKGGDSKLR